MRIPELLQNPEPYLGKEITLTGVVHSSWTSYSQWDWYLADYVLQTKDEWPEDRMILEWLPMPPEPDEKLELFQQLEKLLLKNVSLGDARYRSVTHHDLPSSRYGKRYDKTLNYGSISVHLADHWRYSRLRSLAYVFENSDDSWKTIKEPFIDSEIEAQLLELYKQITYEKPKLLFSKIIDRRYSRNPLKGWLEGEITGRLEQHNGDLVLKDAWKAVIQTNESTSHIVLKDQQAYFEQLDGKRSIPVRQVLQNPQTYLGKRITIHGLFTNDLVFLDDTTVYARIVPNRLYYEYRSKWDNRVSLHLKLSGVTGLLSSDPMVPGEIQRLSPNRGCLDVRLTGTLIPPENEHSSIILDDITDVVSIHDGLIQDWMSYRYQWDDTYWRSEQPREL